MVKLQKLTTGCMLAGALGFSPNVFADVEDCCIAMEDIAPIIGVDYQFEWFKARNDWSNFFPKRYAGANFYIGAKLCDFFGAEFGWDWYSKTHTDWAIARGGSYMSTPAPSAFVGKTNIRQTGGHFDIYGYLPLYDCWDLMAGIGYGWIHPRADILVSTAGVDNTTNQWQAAFSSVSGRTRAVWRLRLGASYMMTDIVGIRAIAGAQGTRRLRLRGNTSFDAVQWDNHAFRNSLTMSVGAFIQL